MCACSGNDANLSWHIILIKQMDPLLSCYGPHPF